MDAVVPQVGSAGRGRPPAAAVLGRQGHTDSLGLGFTSPEPVEPIPPHSGLRAEVGNERLRTGLWIHGPGMSRQRLNILKQPDRRCLLDVVVSIDNQALDEPEQLRELPRPFLSDQPNEMVSELGQVVVQAGLFVPPSAPMLFPRFRERRTRRQQKRHDLVPLDDGAASTALDLLAILPTSARALDSLKTSRGLPRRSWPLANEAGGRDGRASLSGSACDHRRQVGASFVLAGRALRVPVTPASGGPPRTTTVHRRWA